MANIGAFRLKFKGRLSTFRKGVMLKLFSAVMKDTPVLTGRLRGNWVFNAGTVAEATNNPPDPSGAKTLAAISAGVTGSDTIKDGSYYLSNSMPYANRIEYNSWSHTKAPEGMVRRNVLRIQRLLKERRV